MKRTEWIMAVRQTSTYTVYRRVMTDGQRYYVRDEGRLWDVTDKRYGFSYEKRGTRQTW